MPSARCSFAAAVVNENGSRDDGRRRDAVVSLNDCIHIVGRQNFERGALGRIGHCVRILAHVERAVSAGAPPVIADRLRDGKNVRFGEGAMQRRAAMSAGSETDHLVGIG